MKENLGQTVGMVLGKLSRKLLIFIGYEYVIFGVVLFTTFVSGPALVYYIALFGLVAPLQFIYFIVNGFGLELCPFSFCPGLYNFFVIAILWGGQLIGIALWIWGSRGLLRGAFAISRGEEAGFRRWFFFVCLAWGVGIWNLIFLSGGEFVPFQLVWPSLYGLAYFFARHFSQEDKVSS